MFYARFTNHISEDLQRNWSSWNFGEGGFEGTKDALIEAIQAAIENGVEIEISHFSYYPSRFQVRGAAVVIDAQTEIRELYPKYWVVVGTENGTGISAIELSSDSLENAIIEAATIGAWSGDGECMVDATMVAAIHETDVVNSGCKLYILEVD